MEYYRIQSKITAPSRALTKVLHFLEKNNLSALENGQHNIEGEDFYVNIFGYTTTTEDKRIWEAHREYIDIHVIIDGEEVVRTADLSRCNVVTYHADKDYVEIQSALPQTTALLNPEMLAIFYPEDGHQTGLMVEGVSCTLRKAVFKLRV
ncbi:MAG: YhcH/YjgK/YiaL family protein [Cardiobacteriaceae bacterium]|nr:YhcH/YjgK/YiaL family protein [Cardiobacteriaceae bacterium]